MPRRVFVALAVLLPVFGAASGGAAFRKLSRRETRCGWSFHFRRADSLDAVGRAIADKLTQAWGQSVVVDNRPGAGGNIGADFVAKSPPDGYTVVMGALSTHAVNPSLYREDAVRRGEATSRRSRWSRSRRTCWSSIRRCRSTRSRN